TAAVHAYELADGELHTGATASSGQSRVSISKGGFLQTGGWHDVVASLVVQSPFASGAYVLADGRLTVAGNLSLYAYSGQEASFRQSGGEVQVGAELSLGTV